MYKYHIIFCLLFSTPNVECWFGNLVEIYQNFSASCTSKSGTLLGESEICIPKKYSYTIGYAPTPEKDGRKRMQEMQE